MRGMLKMRYGKTQSTKRTHMEKTWQVYGTDAHHMAMRLRHKLEGLGVGRCCAGATTNVVGCPPVADAIARALG